MTENVDNVDDVDDVDFDKLFKNLEEPKRFVLTYTAPFDAFPERVTKLLKHLYNSKSPTKRIMASILNAAYYGDFLYFLFSQDSLTELLKSDPLQKKTKSLSGTRYKQFLEAVFSGKYLIRIKDYDKSEGKAGIYEVINPYLISLFSKPKKHYAEQFNEVMNFYNRAWEIKTTEPTSDDNAELTQTTDTSADTKINESSAQINWDVQSFERHALRRKRRILKGVI